MNHAQLNFPFKRYQVQPVWRADRPQKGRYREFYQCDCDVVGSRSLLNEVELALIYLQVFEKLGLGKAGLRINHRGLLTALAEACGDAGKMTDITIAIDKLDKIGWEKVEAELTAKGLSTSQSQLIRKYLDIEGTKNEKLDALRKLFPQSGHAAQAIKELEYIFSLLEENKADISLDLTLARGLNYYTGCIFEASAPPEVKIGSIGGGGRYDDLTGLFGVPNIPGVGISFGVDRIYDVLEELDLFPKTIHESTKVLFFNLGEAESRKAFGLMQKLRSNGIAAELFHETTKFDKQFKYAERKNIPYIVIIGEKELANQTCTIKKLESGEQQTIPATDIFAFHFK
jgi:histidyl-tRNA synthetase